MRKTILLVALFMMLAIGFSSAAPYLTEVNIDPQPVDAGEVLTVSYTVVDPLGMTEVETDIYLPGAINHKEASQVYNDHLRYTQQFFIPSDMTGEFPLFLRVSVPGYEPIIQEVPVYINTEDPFAFAQDDANLPAAPITAQAAKVRIVVDPIRDVVKGESIYYPVTVVNTADETLSVSIGMDDVREWASYRIDPYPTLILDAGDREEIWVLLRVDENAQAGLRDFSITASYQGSVDRADVRLAVLEPVAQTVDRSNWVVGIIIFLLIIAIIVVLIMVIYERMQEDEQ